MKNKKLIIIVNLLGAAILIAFGMNLKKGNLYTLNNMEEVEIALEKEFDIDLEGDDEINRQVYTDENVSYFIASIDINDKGYFAVFKAEDKQQYRCVFSQNFEFGTCRLLVDKTNHVYICYGKIKRDFIVEQKIIYQDNKEFTQLLSGYNTLISIECDPNIKKIILSEAKSGSEFIYETETIN